MSYFVLQVNNLSYGPNQGQRDNVITKKVKAFINNPIEQDKFKQELEEIYETLLFSLENDSDT